MQRREFITGSAAIFVCATSSGAGAARVWRIGQVFGGTPEAFAHFGTVQALVDLGYVDGKNIHLLTRFATPNPKEMKEAILGLLPDIDLLVVTGTIGGVAAKSVAPQIPVVFEAVGAPVEIGLVESLSHPGGNMTGVTFEAASETYGKRLQILKEMVPDLSRVAVLGAKGDANVPFAMASLEKSSASLKVSITLIEINFADDLMSAFEQIRRSQSEALIVVAGALTYPNSKIIAELSFTNGLPSCHCYKEAVIAGGLVSLGPDLMALGRQGARLISKIINGARPSDLPVEQPTQYVMNINLKTAKALGITVPAPLLARADEVIE
jgi:putative ABC transport system substrate-binding protein